MEKQKIYVTDSERKLIQDLKSSLGDNLLRYIVELVTNCDDSYSRMEKNGIPNNTTYPIVINLRKGKRKDEKWIIDVIDNAEGMSNKELEEFGKYQSERETHKLENSRGIFGRGASDVLRTASYDGKSAEIKSIRNNVFWKMRYNYEKHGKQPFNVEIDRPVTDNRTIKSFREKYSILDNGTVVSFGIPKNVKWQKNLELKLKDWIEKDISLKFILNNPQRRVIFKFNETETILSSKKYLLKDEWFKSEDNFNFVFDGTNFECNLKLYKNETKNENNINIIVVDENKTVYDNTLFGAETDSRSEKISGILQIKGFYKFCKQKLNAPIEESMKIVEENRTGLDLRSDFYKNLRKIILPYIKSAISKYGGDAKEIDISANKRVYDALKELNRIAKDEIPESIGGDAISKNEEPPSAGIRFVREWAEITEGKQYCFNLLINSFIIPENENILLSVDGNNLEILSSNPITYESSDITKTGLVKKSIVLKALSKSAQPNVITAKFNNLIAKAEINIIEQEIYIPENGFEFSQKEQICPEGKKHKSKLYFSVDTLSIGETISFSTDNGLSLTTKHTIVQQCDMITNNIGCINVETYGGNIDNEYILTASCKNNKASIKIKIKNEKDTKHGGGLFNGVSFKKSLKTPQQSYYQLTDGKIIVNLSNVINQKMLNINEDISNPEKYFKPEHWRYLADLVSYQSALVILKRKKHNINWSNPETAIDNIDLLIPETKQKNYKAVYPFFTNKKDNKEDKK